MSEPPKGPYLGALGDVCTQGADEIARCMCIGIVDYLCALSAFSAFTAGTD